MKPKGLSRSEADRASGAGTAPPSLHNPPHLLCAAFAACLPQRIGQTDLGLSVMRLFNDRSLAIHRRDPEVLFSPGRFGCAGIADNPLGHFVAFQTRLTGPSPKR